MRLFIAINFDKAIKESFSIVQQRLIHQAKGSFTDIENLHLTIVFLGEITEEKIEIIKEQMRRIEIGKIKLIFNSTGYFKRADGDIWWVGMEYNKELVNMQKVLSGLLTNAGFYLEKKDYTPHITIARRVRAYNQINKSSLMDRAFSADINSISLMLSERKNNKQVYTEIYRINSK